MSLCTHATAVCKKKLRENASIQEASAAIHNLFSIISTGMKLARAVSLSVASLVMPALNVLLIDESERDASALTNELSSAGYDVDAIRVDTADALVAALGRRHWDLALSDYTLHELTGARALALVREHGGDLPFIFVSATHGEDAAVEAMRIGAQDFITKDNLARLASAVENGLKDAAERRERLRESERVAYLAFHDELTDLPNRTLLHDRLHHALLEAKREMRPLSLLVLDLDGFKEIND